MRSREISQIKQELFEIQKKPTEEQLKAIQDLAKRLGTPVPTQHGQGTEEFVNETIRHVHTMLQTETMVIACGFTKQSCFWAAVAATAAVLGVAISFLSVTHKTNVTQWEYASYGVWRGFGPGSVDLYCWNTPEENINHIGDINALDQDFWEKCGFKGASGDVRVTDWFTFLGQKNWELISIESGDKNITYWFKRPRKSKGR